MVPLAHKTIKKIKPLTILGRVRNKDKTAVVDCVDTYGNFIWALARKFTATTEEAEAATKEIFIDIWRYSERAEKSQSAESVLIGLIARRRLIRYLQ